MTQNKLIAFIGIIHLLLMTACGSSSNTSCNLTNYSPLANTNTGIGNNVAYGSSVAQSFALTTASTTAGVTVYLSRVGTFAANTYTLTVIRETNTTSYNAILETTVPGTYNSNILGSSTFLNFGLGC